MYKILFRHYLLKSFRSPGFHKNLVINILTGLMIFYFVGIFILMGLLLPKMLGEIAPGQDPAATFNSILLIAVIIILIIRYLMQPLTRLNLELYQALPIKRDTLINYLTLKPLLNPLNYITLCFVIPFAFSGVYPVYGVAGVFRFLFITVFLIWFNTLITPFLKRKFNNVLIVSMAFLGIGALLFALEAFDLFSIIQLSRHLFDFLLQTPLLWMAVLSLDVLAFLLNKSYFARNYYPENFEKRAKKKEKNKDTDLRKFTFMERFGKIGEIISLEMKLVFRHKRIKKALYMGLFFMLYGLLIYPNSSYNESPGWLLLVAIFITGNGMITFGQWIINWDGGHFDFLMTRNIDSYDYINANYWLLISLSILSFIVTTPYFFFGREIMVYHLVALLYNTGVNVYVYLFGATFNTKRLELSEGSAMNMQGVSYKNFIVMIPLLIFPIAVVMIFSLFSASHIGLIIIALIGLTGILFREQLLKIIVKQFLRRKYALCAGFRKKG